jgi:hypothetical protein
MNVTFAYASRALIDPISPDMLAIARSSIARNEALGVTGVLYFDRTSFFQVLEGTASAIEPLFARIAEDARHTDVVPLGQWPGGRRRINDTPMRFVDGTRHNHEGPNFDFDQLVSSNGNQRRAAALALLRA